MYVRGDQMKENIYQKRIKNWKKKYGTLSIQVQQKIDKLVEQYDKTQTTSKESKCLSITNGTTLIREFHGEKHSVTVILNGYEYNGKNYKSLSAIANVITGKHWNGKKFFGVT